MFTQFCVALAMECIHQKHGRQFTAQCVMDDCIAEVIEIEAAIHVLSVIPMPDNSGQRVH